MIVFAAVLLGMLGLFNVIDGIAAVARSHVFIANAHYVIGDLRAWRHHCLRFPEFAVGGYRGRRGLAAREHHGAPGPGRGPAGLAYARAPGPAARPAPVPDHEPEVR
jgi:hypothetical protein